MIYGSLYKDCFDSNRRVSFGHNSSSDINGAKAYAQEPIKVILCDEEGDCIDIRYNGKLRVFVSK